MRSAIILDVFIHTLYSIKYPILAIGMVVEMVLHDVVLTVFLKCIQFFFMHTFKTKKLKNI